MEMENIPTEETIIGAIDQVRMEEFSLKEGYGQIEDALKQVVQCIPVQSVFAPQSMPGVKGFVKRVFLKLFRWYIDPVIAQQDRINEQFASVLQMLTRCIQQLEQERTRMARHPDQSSCAENRAGSQSKD